MDHVVTLIIHGTFAADGSWWRLGGEDKTFADRLEEALAERGLSGTVWQPALDAGLSYRDFSWSGENLDADRKAGGKQLAAGLEALAGKLGATEASPLVVHLVAHSHGGNVVLEACRWLRGPVRIGRIVMLGTPLISLRPKFRPLRLLMSYLLMTLAILLLLSFPIWGLLKLFEPSIRPIWQDIGLLKDYLPAIVDYLPVVVVGLGIVLVLAAWLFEAAWAVLGRLLMRWRGRQGGHAYGPVSPPPATLLTSRLDEADLLLQLGAAPQRLYNGWIGGRPLLVRILIAVLVRYTVIAFSLNVVELTLERLVLGFSWWRVPFFDYSMAKLKEGRHYRSIRRIDVQKKLSSRFSTRSAPTLEDLSGTILTRQEESGRDQSGAEAFQQALAEVVWRLKTQLRLRHSMYYESIPVIEDVADAIQPHETQA